MSLKKNKTAGRVMMILLALLSQGCTKQAEIKLPDKTVRLVEGFAKQRSETVYEEPAPLLKTTSSMQDYWKALDYALDNQNASSPSRTLTKKEAMEDTRALFELLKQLYGCYAFFDEQRSFEQAEEAILQDLKLYSKLDYETYRTCVRTHLQFLEDQHFLIDGTPLQRPMTTVTLDEAFEKRSGGFYFRNRLVAAIDDEQALETLLKPDVIQKGRYVYFQKTAPQKTSITIHFEKGKSLRQTVYPIISFTAEKAMEEKTLENVPYVQTARMFYMRSEKKKADAFLNTAKEFRGRKAAILDLRGNGGGDLLLAEEWYRSFSAAAEGGHISTILKLPLRDPLLGKKFQGMEVNQSLKDLRNGENWKQLDGLHYMVERNSKGLKKNDTVLFVLQDDRTASAAEHLIDRLHSLDNVVFIGTPTAGMLRGSSFLTVYLKHSSLAVSFGNMLSQFPDTYAKEYYGIEPDIWTSDAAGVVEQLLTQ